MSMILSTGCLSYEFQRILMVFPGPDSCPLKAKACPLAFVPSLLHPSTSTHYNLSMLECTLGAKCCITWSRMDTTYWTARRDIVEKEIQATLLSE